MDGVSNYSIEVWGDNMSAAKKELEKVLEEALVMWESSPAIADAIEALIDEKLSPINDRISGAELMALVF